MLGFNGGLMGKKRKQEPTTPGLWFPNERAIIAGSDSYWDNVSLLLHMDGSNGSTTFTDSSSNVLTVTANGNTQISTAQSKFGGASGLFDGTGDFLTIADTAILDFGTQPFTIEAWVYVSSFANYPFLFSKYASGLNSWFVQLESSAIYFGFDANVSSNYGTFATTINTNQWTHIAAARSGAVLGAYVNGVGSTQTVTNADLDKDNNNQLYIGRYHNSATAYDFTGYVDDYRITKGVARYTANFTPPTAAFPNG
jgi:hypothetical protein